MPKKTKKEKLLAMQRRSQASPVVIRDKTVNGAPESAHSNTFSFSLSPAHTPTPTKHTSTGVDYTLMKKDLIKTLIITTAILVSEVLLTKWLPQ